MGVGLGLGLGLGLGFVRGHAPLALGLCASLLHAMLASRVALLGLGLG